MTKSEALQTYFENFGIDAYPFTAVPDDVKFPWLTYEYIASAFGDGDVPVTVNLWFRTESELIPNIRAEEFRQYIEKMT
ncbi:MAG: hypothetical protein Q4D45_12990 [Lachnospiraceae bacterium]|nr:hypothetical protein [Lachnospiraceae bacterium]